MKDIITMKVNKVMGLILKSIIDQKKKEDNLCQNSLKNSLKNNNSKILIKVKINNLNNNSLIYHQELNLKDINIQLIQAEYGNLQNLFHQIVHPMYLIKKLIMFYLNIHIYLIQIYLMIRKVNIKLLCTKIPENEQLKIMETML